MITRFYMTAAILILTACGAFAMGKSPGTLRQFTLEGGYQYTTGTTFSFVGKQAGSVLLSMGYRMNHLDAPGPATYLTIPMGYFGIPTFEKADKRYTGVLFYGWTIRHELVCVKQFTPFLEYGLLLNQLFVSGIDGRTMAHQTLLAGGTDITLSPDWALLLKLEYGMSTYPSLGVKASEKINTFAVKTGLRWGGKPKKAKVS